MSASLEPYQEAMLAHPLTAEVIELATAPDDILARFLWELREAEQSFRDAKRLVNDEVLRRQDMAASWTIRAAGGWTLKGASPEPMVEYDAAALRSDLLALVDEGVLLIEAVDDAVETVVTYKPRKAGIRRLRKLGGRVAEMIDRHAFQVDRKRYVTVTRSGQ